MITLYECLTSYLESVETVSCQIFFPTFLKNLFLSLISYNFLICHCYEIVKVRIFI